MAETVNVLILYQFKEHENLLRQLKVNLKRFDIELALFNTRNFKFSDDKTNYWFLQILAGIPKIRTIAYKLFRNRLIRKLANDYDIIDIHFFSSIYDSLLAENFHPNIKISFWGSDAYRISKTRKEKLNELTTNSKLIRFNTVEMLLKMEKVFEHKAKLGFQIFGNEYFKKISSINTTKIQAKEQLKIPLEKTSVIIGYNASQGQQHEHILNQLTNLPDDLKNKLVLVLPLTYGGDLPRKKEIIEIAKKTAIETIYFTNSLTELELCKLRLCSDIAINLQISDAFSASLQEHFYTNTLMILGNWLPYDWLAKKGLKFYAIDKDQLNECLLKVVDNIELEQMRCSANKHIISSISSWEYVCSDWRDDYIQMIQAHSSE